MRNDVNDSFALSKIDGRVVLLLNFLKKDLFKIVN